MSVGSNKKGRRRERTGQANGRSRDRLCSFWDYAGRHAARTESQAAPLQCGPCQWQFVAVRNGGFLKILFTSARRNGLSVRIERNMFRQGFIRITNCIDFSETFPLTPDLRGAGDDKMREFLELIDRGASDETVIDCMKPAA